MNKEIFLHTGLAKTGTKFLQNNFFPKLQGIKYIPKPLYHRSMDIIRSTNYKRYLVSQEYDQQFDEEIRKWAEFEPNTKVIIVFRRQDSWFASEYRRFVKNGFRGSFRDFIDIEHDGGYFKIKDGLYMPKIRLVEQLFNHPPFVTLYDDLRKDPVRFLHLLSLFLDTDFSLEQVSLKPRHTSYEEKQLKVMRKFGRFFGVAIRPYDDQHRLKRTFQRFSRMIPRYLLLYSAFLVPNALLDKEPLIPKDYLEQLRLFYEDDWQQTIQYARNIQKFYLGEF